LSAGGGDALSTSNKGLQTVQDALDNYSKYADLMACVEDYVKERYKRKYELKEVEDKFTLKVVETCAEESWTEFTNSRWIGKMTYVADERGPYVNDSFEYDNYDALAKDYVPQYGAQFDTYLKELSASMKSKRGIFDADRYKDFDTDLTHNGSEFQGTDSKHDRVGQNTRDITVSYYHRYGEDKLVGPHVPPEADE